jgi:hypothetical protein
MDKGATMFGHVSKYMPLNCMETRTWRIQFLFKKLLYMSGETVYRKTVVQMKHKQETQ